MTGPYWTHILSALLMPTIAIFGTILTYKQWRSAQNKLKMELFEKRYSIYDSSKRFLLLVLGSNKTDDEIFFKFRTSTYEAKWILNENIALYLDKQIWDEAINLQTLQAELEGVPAGEERTKNLQSQRDIKHRLQSQFELLDKKFTPFLTLTH